MKTVFKFSLPVVDHALVQMPRGAQILTVDQQYNQAYIWALVDNAEPYVNHKFTVHGTGHPANDVEGLAFVGSLILMEGAFVGHVWDGGELP